eukprot:GHVP01054393.1.p1 GENE.GHVP01054393.1~~GHVP01054393.1.p1  ORF type:complete len:302 (-),score=55.89 GHVP01054393.1:146-1051(-)
MQWYPRSLRGFFLKNMSSSDRIGKLSATLIEETHLFMIANRLRVFGCTLSCDSASSVLDETMKKVLENRSSVMTKSNSCKDIIFGDMEPETDDGLGDKMKDRLSLLKEESEPGFALFIAEEMRNDAIPVRDSTAPSEALWRTLCGGVVTEEEDSKLLASVLLCRLFSEAIRFSTSESSMAQLLTLKFETIRLCPKAVQELIANKFKFEGPHYECRHLLVPAEKHDVGITAGKPCICNKHKSDPLAEMFYLKKSGDFVKIGEDIVANLSQKKLLKRRDQEPVTSNEDEERMKLRRRRPPRVA